MFIPLAQGRGILASFPGSTLRNVNIEVVQAIHIRVPGEPGNEATRSRVQYRERQEALPRPLHVQCKYDRNPTAYI